MSFIPPTTTPVSTATSNGSEAILTRPTEYQDEVRIGRRAGVTGWTKFGYNDNIDSADGEVVIWASATTTFSYMQSAGTWDITYNASVSADGADGIGALELGVFYIDASGNEAYAQHVLGSSGTDTTSFTGFGINRAVVVSAGSTNYNIDNITFRATSANTIQATIPPEGSVTQQAIFFVGTNYTATAKFLWVNVNKVGGASAIVTIKGYIINRSNGVRYEVFRETIDTGVENTVSINEPVYFNLSPTDILYFVADTDTNDTIVNLRFSLNHYKNE